MRTQHYAPWWPGAKAWSRHWFRLGVTQPPWSRFIYLATNTQLWNKLSDFLSYTDIVFATYIYSGPEHLIIDASHKKLYLCISCGVDWFITPHMKYDISCNWHTGINAFFLDPYLCLENIWKEKTLVYVLKKPNSQTSEVACVIFGLTASILWLSINWLAPFVAMGLLYLSNSSYSSYYDTVSFLRNLTIHSCPHFNGDLAKPPLKLGHGLVITPHQSR